MDLAEGKRTEVISTKLSERMALDLLRAATSDDRSISEFIYLLIRKELYGRTVTSHGSPEQST